MIFVNHVLFFSLQYSTCIFTLFRVCVSVFKYSYILWILWNLCSKVMIINRLFTLAALQVFVHHQYTKFTRMGWIVNSLTMMQYSNFRKCGLFFNIVSTAVHTLLPSLLQHLDSHSIEALVLILEKVLNCRYDPIISLICFPAKCCFFRVGETENR